MPTNRKDRNIRRRASPAAVLAAIAAIAALVMWLLPSRALHLPANLSLSLLDGRTTTLAALRGRPVLVAFWATTCGPCVEEIPDLVQLYHEFHPRGLELVAVTMPYDPPLQVQRFAQRNHLPYPVAFDVSGTIARAFGGVDFIPSTFLLDAEGNVLVHRTGKLDLVRVRRLLERELVRAPRSS